MVYIVIFISALVVSGGLTAIAVKLAVKADFVSRPVNGRHSKKIIPLGGGIAIVVTLLATMGMLLLLLMCNRLPASISMGECGLRAWAIVGICILALMILGLIDDKRNLGVVTKLIIQFAIAAAAVCLADVRVEFFIHNKIVTSAMSVLWIVFIINVFNFLDNMDGTCSSIAIVIALVLLVSMLMAGQIMLAIFTIVFVGAMAGFLIHNFPPAKIYAGDAGSLVIGFCIAFLTLKTIYYQQGDASGSWCGVFVPLVVLAVPFYDFLSVTFLRIKQKKSPFVGDTQHFSHRLKLHGLTDRQVVLTLSLATICTGLSALFLRQVNTLGSVLIFGQTIMILAIVAIFESTSKNGKADAKA